MNEKKLNPLAAARAAHQAEMNAMSTEERMMHVMAGAINLSQQFDQIQASIAEAVESGAPLSARSGIMLPVAVVWAGQEIIGEMMAILEEHKLFDRKAAEKYLEDKRNEEAGEQSDKPEGYCESCQRVHSDDEDEQTMGGGMPAGLRGIARAILGSILAEEARRRGMQEEPETADTAEAAPPGTPLH